MSTTTNETTNTNTAITYTRKLYRELAGMVDARIRCKASNNDEWTVKHHEHGNMLVGEFMPSGSGFDSGTTLDWDMSTSERLVFNTSFHHMNDGGMYDGWTEHQVTVKASLIHGFTLSISGPNRNDIKTYMYDEFRHCLETSWTDEQYHKLFT